MGHQKRHSPHRGSKSYNHIRASSLKPRPRVWQQIGGKARLTGMVGFKAGMTHAAMIEDRKNIVMTNQEVIVPVTILEVPPIVVLGMRGYENTNAGLQIAGEAWAEKFPVRELSRAIKLPKESKTESQLKELQERLDSLAELRAIVCTQPALTGIGQKKPHILELGINADSMKDAFDYGKNLLGSEVLIENVFSPGQYVDTFAITTGKGFQGVIKRQGVKLEDRKSRKTKRGVGTLGPWNPHRIRYTVARYGQMGLNRRCQLRIRVLGMGVDGTKVTPKGGFVRYGEIKNRYVILKGSIPGPKKRLILLRETIRPQEKLPIGAPVVKSISTLSQQGRRWETK